jgi:hypothetical protein
MTKEEIAKKGIANLTSLNILSDSQKGKPIKLKEFLMLYIDDMKGDEQLISICENERERTFAYAIIALNDRIMRGTDPTESYNIFINELPATQEDFDEIRDERN